VLTIECHWNNNASNRDLAESQKADKPFDAKASPNDGYRIMTWGLNCSRVVQ